MEDDPQDEQLLRQALDEIEENYEWGNWRRSSIVQVQQLSEAVDCLQRDWFDAVLLNLSLPDSPALLDSFLEANAYARGAAIVILADEEDENLAHRLLREGAQDVLTKSELECKLLARCLRYSIERQRLTSALRTAPFVDHLTGTLTRQGFLTIAGYYARLRHSRQPQLMASLEIAQISEKTQEEREAAHLVLIRAAEALRDSFESPALIGRVGPCRFGLITSGLAKTTVEALLNQAAAGIESAAISTGRSWATVRFAATELDGEGSLEELLGENSEEFAARCRRPLKTVMLAD